LRHAFDDIVLFKLSESLTFNRFMLPLCLPEAEGLSTRRAIASGWGTTGFAEDVSNALQKVTIEYFDQATCNEVFEDDPKLRGQGVDWAKMVCAGSSNKTGDTCQGELSSSLNYF